MAKLPMSPKGDRAWRQAAQDYKCDECAQLIEGGTYYIRWTLNVWGKLWKRGRACWWCCAANNVGSPLKPPVHVSVD